MVAAVICREYGWTYEEYLNQPAHFIDTIVALLEVENTVRNKNKPA